MYHRVNELDNDPWCLSVSPQYFKEHMQILKKFAQPTAMRDMGSDPKHLSLGGKRISITFDDGYKDNFQNAKPILEQYEMPATFYVTSGSVNAQEEFWWDELGRHTLTPPLLPDAFDLNIKTKRYSWKISREKYQGRYQYIPGIPANNKELSGIQLYYALWEIIGHLSFQEKQEALLKIAQWAGLASKPRPNYLTMSPQELLSLSNSKLFEIGGHTVHHSMLSRLSAEEQKNEILNDKTNLETMIDRPLLSFSYPHGDYSTQTMEIVKNSRFENACTAEPRAVMANTDPFLLPRFMVQNWSGEKFEKNLRQWFS